MAKLPKIRPQFRANLAAQGIAFILNITLFVLTNNYFFIWTELACFCFFGGHIAKSPTFIDRNILNHFISMMTYSLISFLI